MNNYLEHHGIKNQKWGVKNGPPYPLSRNKNKSVKINRTPFGGKNKNKDNGPDKRINKITNYSRDITNSTKNLTRDIDKATNLNRGNTKVDLSEITDQELRNRINRLDLENRYNYLTSSDNTAKGKDYVLSLLDITGDVVSIAGSAAALYMVLKTAKRANIQL